MEMRILFLVVCGILSVKGTPFYSETNAVVEEHELKPSNLTVNSNKTQEVESPQGNNDTTIQGSMSETTILVDPALNQSHGNESILGQGTSQGHFEDHLPSQIGPVELGLRNVVSASAIATEELFMEMAALNAETSDMIRTKSEILTSKAMNGIFIPLNLAESAIKNSQECGRQFVDALNAILAQVDSSLKTCVHNLTVIGEAYNNQSTPILLSISRIADELQNLPESCELSQKFAFGTFCVVSNLAEANSRVVSDVKDMKYLTTFAKEKVTKVTLSIVACHEQLVAFVTEKFDKLLTEVDKKCGQQVKLENNLN